MGSGSKTGRAVFSGPVGMLVPCQWPVAYYFCGYTLQPAQTFLCGLYCRKHNVVLDCDPWMCGSEVICHRPIQRDPMVSKSPLVSISESFALMGLPGIDTVPLPSAEVFLGVSHQRSQTTLFQLQFCASSAPGREGCNKHRSKSLLCGWRCTQSLHHQ